MPSGGILENPLVRQMVINFLMFTLIVGVIYIFAYPDSQMAATTSAIGQIWTGSCRLSCRQNQYNQLNGINAVAPGNSSNNKGFYVGRTSVQETNNCVCDFCPCALIDNFISTARPATTMYSTAVQFVANMYYTVIETLSQLYNYVQRIMNCHTSCQRPQLIQNKDSGSDIIYFGNKPNKHLEKAKEKTKNVDAGVPTSKSIIFRDVSDTGKNQKESTSKNAFGSNNVKKGASDASLKPSKEDKKTKSKATDASNSCPKCLKQGKVCMKDCPKAAKKKK